MIPKNLDEVLQRSQRFVRAIIQGNGARRFRASVKRIVLADYDAAFSGRGQRFRERWRTSKGPVTLQESGGFRQSIQESTVSAVTTGSRVTIKMTAGEYRGRKGGTPLSYLDMIRKGVQLSETSSLQVRLRGEYGGVSRRAEKRIFREFRTMVRNQGRQVGYKVS